MILEALKYRRSILYPFIIIILLIAVSFVFGDLAAWYEVEREDAITQLNELLSNFISLLGIGLAILAVLFAIIQLAYKQLSIISLLIKESFFLPVFYFGMVNILICSILSSFQYDKRLYNDYIYIRLIVTEGYIFWILTPSLCLVFYKAVQLSNFSFITELYIKNAYSMAVKEKANKTSIQFRESLQALGFEVRDEISRLIDESKIILLNKFLDFYLSVIKLNHNSKLLEDIHESMARWFIQSYKQADKTIFRNLITRWWEFYMDLLLKGSFDKTRFLSTLPLNLYQDYRKTKDPDIRFIAIQVFPIRLKEIALMLFYTMKQKQNDFDDQLRRIQTSLGVFPDLVKVVIDEGDAESLNTVLTQMRLFANSIGYELESLEIKLKLQPKSFTVQDNQLIEVLQKLQGQIDALFLNAYSWVMFKLDEHE